MAEAKRFDEMLVRYRRQLLNTAKDIVAMAEKVKVATIEIKEIPTQPVKYQLMCAKLDSKLDEFMINILDAILDHHNNDILPIEKVFRPPEAGGEQNENT